MINNATILGRLAKDPELKSTSTGKSVTSFTLAVNGYNESTDWIDCVAWGNDAENISKHFHKGSMIAVSGRIQTRTYESNGKKNKATEIVVNSWSFCESKSASASASNDDGFKEIPMDDDDEGGLPF